MIINKKFKRSCKIFAVCLCVLATNCQKKNDNPPPANPKPVANFNFTIVNNGDLPCTVHFTDSSKYGSTYKWDFGDGNSSAIQKPDNIYQAAKTYNVKLVVSNSFGRDSITKQVVIKLGKPLSGFTFTINNTGSLPVSVMFTNTAKRASSYMWDFNDGSTSAAPNPQHNFTKNDAYSVRLIVTNAAGSDTSIKVVNLSKSPFTQTYVSFDNKTYNLYSWEGKYVAILMRNNNLDATTMFNWVHTMDSCYSWYKSVTGKEPIKYAPTYLDNHTTIADVATTCGAGCGYLGFTGVEMQNVYTDRMYNFILQNNEYDQELFYEFGRNFWFYGDQLAYKTNDPVTTGYAIFMRFMAMDAVKVNPAPFNNTPWITFRTDLEDLVNIYQNNSSYNWNNTLGVSAGVNNPLNLGAGDLLASFLIRLQRDYGGNAFVNSFWKQAGTMPTAVTTQDAVDNFVLAACAAANKNLTNLFVNTWRWPVSANAQSLASKYP